MVPRKPKNDLTNRELRIEEPFVGLIETLRSNRVLFLRCLRGAGEEPHDVSVSVSNIEALPPLSVDSTDATPLQSTESECIQVERH